MNAGGIIYFAIYSRVVSEEKLKHFELSGLDTDYLEELIADAKREISKRKSQMNINARRNFIASLHAPSYDCSHIEYNARASAINSKKIWAIRNIDTAKIDVLKQYIPALLTQDWSDVYSGGCTDKRYYVYAHVDPRAYVLCTDEVAGGNYGGSPFYIGKGAGSRAYDLKRNQGHGKTINAILDDGFESRDIVKILFSGLTECKALEMEAKLIYCFGTIYQNNRKNGLLYNLDVPKTPIFGGVMVKMLTKSGIRALRDAQNECPKDQHAA